MRKCYYCGVDESDCSSDFELTGKDGELDEINGHLECCQCYGLGRHEQ